MRELVLSVGHVFVLLLCVPVVRVQQPDGPDPAPVPQIYAMRVEFTDEEGSSHDGPPVVGFKDGLTQVHHGIPVTIVLVGQNLLEVKSLSWKMNNCSANEDTPEMDEAQFDKGHVELLEFKYMFPEAEQTYILCVKLEDGTVQNYGSNSRLQVTTEVPPRTYYLPFGLQIVVIAFLLVLSGLFSGLNLGLMALEPTDLELIKNSGTKAERRDAEIILPVRKTGNYLLCSLLMGNVIVNSAISILFDNLTSGFVALAVSSLGIVIFGEIVPQSICVKKGLAVGARTIWITRFFMVLTFPMSWPIGKLLDFVLGSEAGVVYNRDRLIELIKMSIGKEGATAEEFAVIAGALEYTKKTVNSVMTRIDDVFMLPSDTVLDVHTIADVIQTGYTRIPVYEGDRNQVVALLNVKDLALLDPDDNLTVKTVCGYWDHPVRFVLEDTPLKVMLDEFKKGHYHLALVQKIEEPDEGDNYYHLTGLVTLEDIIEEILQAEIVDETDVITDNVKKKRRHDVQVKDFSRLLQHETTQHASVSLQLQVAAVQWLTTNLAAFLDENISNTVMQKLIRQNVRLERPSHLVGMPPKMLYKKQEPSDKFVLILEGRVEVVIGKGNLTFEAGPFHQFGAEVLDKMLQIAPSWTHPAINYSRQSLPGNELMPSSVPRHSLAQARSVASFIPDFEAIVRQDVTYLLLSADNYLSAFRATLIERGKVPMMTGNLSSPTSDDIKGGISDRGRSQTGRETGSMGSGRMLSSGNSLDILSPEHNRSTEHFDREDSNRATIGTTNEAHKLLGSLRRASVTDSNLPSSVAQEEQRALTKYAGEEFTDERPSFTTESPDSNSSRKGLVVRTKPPGDPGQSPPENV